MIEQLTDSLPPREVLWEIVQEAHDYLHEWLTDPSSRTDPTYGQVILDTSFWGRALSGRCVVCIAGLWFLRKQHLLLEEAWVRDDIGEHVPIASFLEKLLWVSHESEYLGDVLGISIPEDLHDTLGGGDWDRTDLEHILALLRWLLAQHSIQEVLPV